MTTNQKNQKQQQNGALSANSVTNTADQTAEKTDLHIEQTTPMQADKEAFKQQ